MQIVTDRGCDVAPQQVEGVTLHTVPMLLTLDGKTYSSGVDITAEGFYDLLTTTNSFPTTSQPSAGEFAKIYRELAQTDPEILSIHVSSGLSGTLDSARAAAAMVPEAKVTFWDTMTLSCPEGWQVEAAARMLQANWPLDRILTTLKRISDSAEGIYTLDTLKYLIHGGRISHLKGLLASVLHIMPIIGVSKETGKYIQVGQERTIKRALQKLADVCVTKFGEGTPLRVQLLHGKNHDALEILREAMMKRFECHFTPEVRVAPILGAHTGGSLVGLGVAPLSIFDGIPNLVIE